MRKYLLLLIFIFAAVFNLKAWNNLRIIDPMNPWYDLPSSITQADITFHPKGTFIEVGMYLTFATDKEELDSTVQLEAIYNFDLPANAMISDSWLWIEGEPEKALILDRWTASAIYEGIVERRRDPSILTKIDPTSYELRVYPLTSNMPRKVKITYLVPANWSSSQVTVPVPLPQLMVGWQMLEEVSIFTQTDTVWVNPTIKSDSVLELMSITGSEYPVNMGAVLPLAELTNTNYTLAFDSPMENGLFVNHHPEGDAGYYQLALLPSALLDVDEPKKICFLVDYKGSQGSLSTILESTIRNNLSETDSFNIMVSGIEIEKASTGWLPAHDDTISNVFESLEDLTNSYTVLPMLIAEGMKFTGDNGTLLIISDDYSINSNTEANQLIQDLGAYKPWPVIHVLDLNLYYYGIWMGGRNYYGNEYFYGLLTRQTNGNYVSLRNGKDINQNLEELVQSAGGFISSFDLYTTLEQGFCFSRYNAGLIGSTAYLNRPILQVGRYNGNFPFNLILSGVYNDQAFSEEITIQNEDIYLTDTVAKQIWSGMYIQSLEQSPASNELIGEIISESLENRILTYYTAFLTLEPGMVIEEIDEEDQFREGGDIAINVEEELPATAAISLAAYPNPFSAEITFNLEIPADEYDENASLRIYNVSGQLVRIINLSDYPEEEQITLTWDGKDGSGEEIDQGIYIVRYLSKKATKTLRVVKVR
jgi:Ca-activated chloride channel family protein